MKKARMNVFGIIVLVMFVVLGKRLWDIQVTWHDELSSLALRQQTIRLILGNYNAAEGKKDFKYLYLIKKDKLYDMGARENEYYRLIERVYGEKLTKDDSDYLVYGSGFYSARVSEILTERFGTLIIKDADTFNNIIYAYADRDGNFIPGMPILQ